MNLNKGNGRGFLILRKNKLRSNKDVGRYLFIINDKILYFFALASQ